MKKKDRRKGGMLVLFLPFVFAFFVCSILVWDVGREALSKSRAQSTADAVLLSSLRIRAEGLQTVSDRWNEFGELFVEGYSGQRVLLPSGLWNVVKQKAQTLKRALPGYKGRITSVRSVVLEANGFSGDEWLFIEEDAMDLGLSPEPVTLVDENGRSEEMPAGWYRRLWAPEEVMPQPPENSQGAVLFVLSLIGQTWAPKSLSGWPVSAASSARLTWDVDIDHPVIRLHGNGGFPRNWDQVLLNNQVDPFRYPLYEGELSSLVGGGS